MKNLKVSKNNLRAFLVGGILAVSGQVFANANTEQCWGEASQMYGVDPALLMAIAWKESRGRVSSVGPILSDGNRALGLMQINTIHMSMLSRHGIRKEDLFDPCVSKKIGAYVLADCIKRFGSSWKAVGCYYGGPASKAYRAMRGYQADVKRYYAGYLGLIQNEQFASTQNLKQLPQFGSAVNWSD